MSYAEVNGLHLYYEVQGEAREKTVPLVLLHGALEAGTAFGSLSKVFEQSRQVIVVDLQAHGRTADIDRTMRLEALADDIAALLAHLNITQADVLGYSLGGGVATRIAIQHPHLLRKLIVVSFPFKSAGRHPEIAAGLKQMGPQAAEGLKGSPPYQLYTNLAPRPEDWTQLVTRVGEAMGRDFDWTASIPSIPCPVMLVYGDADMFPPTHGAECFALLGGGLTDGGWDDSGMTPHRLAILPGTTHYNIMGSSLLVPALFSFLGGQ